MAIAKPHLFVALYAGNTIGEARVIAASDDSELVQTLIAALLPAQETTESAVSYLLSKSHDRALRLLGQEEGGNQ